MSFFHRYVPTSSADFTSVAINTNIAVVASTTFVAANLDWAKLVQSPFAWVAWDPVFITSVVIDAASGKPKMGVS